MTVHDLLFRRASELAALVRSGEITARELVSASLERIEALDAAAQRLRRTSTPSGALATADAIGPGDERPFAGVPIAIKDNRAGRGHAADLRRRPVRRLRARRSTHTVVAAPARTPAS